MVGREDLFGAIQDADAAADDVLDRFLPHEVPEALRTHHVVTILLAHDGAEWLPRTSAALDAQVRPPGLVVGVDAGSRDDSADWLAAACATVVTIGRREGLADAVSAGVRAVTELAATASVGAPRDERRAGDVAAGRPVAWYWIIHDDTAPEPDCLQELLLGADRNPGAAVVVPKAVSWADRGVLVGIGHKWAPGTPVVERLERGERDQGQYDFDRPVYAADSGGMLVRADAWHALGGFDGFTGMWAAPYDFCRRVWGAGGEVVFVPAAVVAHRQAGHRGVRSSAHGRLRPRRSARRGQLYLELTQAPLLALPGRILMAVLSTALRTLGVLLTREPEESTAELAGAWDVLGHPRRLAEGRRRVRRPPVADLVRPPQCRAYRGTATKRLLEHWAAVSRVRWRPPSRWRVPVTIWRPLALAAGLAVAAVLRRPDQLLGTGDLQGGGLLPAAGALGLLDSYLSSWQDTWFGSDAIPPAYLALLAATSVLTLGSVDAVLRVVFTLAVPLAYLSAHASIGPRLDPARRTALALAWACLPAGVAAAGAGRVSTLGLLLLGPPAARALLDWWSVADQRRPAARRTVLAGTLLGVLASFAPLTLVVVVVAGGVAWLLRGSPRAARARSGLGVIAVAGVFVAPWSTGLYQAPWLLLSDLGRNAPDLVEPGPFVLGLSPGGPGSLVWPGALLVSLAVVLVLVRATRPAVLAAFTGALALLVVAAWAGPAAETLWPSMDLAAVWPGQSLLIAGGLLACVVAASTGPRSPRLVVGAGLACVVSLLVGWWGAEPGPTVVTSDTPLPPVVALDADGPGRVRALVLQRRSGELEYGVSSGPRALLGDADAIAATPGDGSFTDAVEGLVSGAAGDVGPELGDRGIRYVVFNGSPRDEVVSEVDAVPGLRRLASSDEQSLWLVSDDPVRARLGPAGGSGPVDVPVLTSPTSIDVVLHPQTVLPRQLRVAERMSSGWRVTLGDADVAVIPSEQDMVTAAVTMTGRLTVRHAGPWRLLGPAHLALLAALVVLALPKRRTADPGELS